MMKKALIILAAIITVVCGCRTTTIVHDDFSDDEYVWENWNISTNTINIIEVNF